MPTGTLVNDSLPVTDRLSWLVLLLPHLEEDARWRQIDQGLAWNHPTNCAATGPMLKVVACPSQVAPRSGLTGYTTYVGIAGLGNNAALLSSGDRARGVFGYERLTRWDDISDGSSQTMMIADTSSYLGPWAQGGTSTVRGVVTGESRYVGEGHAFGRDHRPRERFASIPSSLEAAMADGTVRSISPTISADSFQSLATIAGQDLVGSDW